MGLFLQPTRSSGCKLEILMDAHSKRLINCSHDYSIYLYYYLYSITSQTKCIPVADDDDVGFPIWLVIDAI